MPWHAVRLRVLFAFAVLALVVHQPCGAIPAFARKYNVSCNLCHSPVPRLTPTGSSFLADGFRLPHVMPADSARDTGDDKLMLLREIPLSLRFDGMAQYRSKNTPAADFQWPFLMKIISGGEITNSVSYYLYFIFNEAGSIGGVEDAFVRFTDIAGLGVDVTVGQFQVIDPVVERELRPTVEDYAIYTVKPGRTKADLTYDRGLILGYRMPTETELSLSVLNGNGIGGADGSGNFDSDPYKNVFIRAAQPLGENVKIGGCLYIGKERDEGFINRIFMAGPDASMSFGTFGILGGYVYRNDTDPFFSPAPVTSIRTRGGFLQLAYQPEIRMSNWFAFLLYNDVRSDLPELRYRSIAGNLSWLLARNFKIMGEYGYDVERERHRLTIGFVTAL